MVGRQLSNVRTLSVTVRRGREQRVTREPHALRTFLEVFLIRNEDSARRRLGDSATKTGLASSRCLRQRTILRSLMLILLLDMAKHTKIISSRLFHPSSPYKSSRSVLNALAKMLLPSVGDVPRALRHLNYSVQHTQYLLQEYGYKITNLAIDMRDGVRLTHLVELLLHSSASRFWQPDDGNVMTPAGEIPIASLKQGDFWMVSSHLILPCPARSQKIYNVQIALDALRAVNAFRSLVKGLTADDVVDGYREKTVGLLWALVSQLGLSTLVNWKELERETARIRKRQSRGQGGQGEEVGDRQGFTGYTFSLMTWARHIVGLSWQEIHNVPTAFADGLIFAKIVDEYATYLPCSQNESRETRRMNTTLESKLRRLGCNRYFGK